jgi:hypothetical protein
MTKPASKTSERRSQNSIGCIDESAEQLDTGEAAASAVRSHLAKAG